MTLSSTSCTGPSWQEVSLQTKAIYDHNKLKFFNVIEKNLKKNKEFQNFTKDHVNLIVADFDHTLADTETTVPVVKADGSSVPLDSKCLVIAQDDKADFEALTQEELLKTKPVEPGLKRLSNLRHKSNYIVILTARSQEHVYTSIPGYLKQFDMRADVIVPINHSLYDEELWNRIELPAKVKKLSSSMKKPLMIVALHDYANYVIKRRGAIHEILYLEDTDTYIDAYMKLMPKVLPNTTARVYDYIRHGKPFERYYVEQYIGYNAGEKFVTPENKVIDLTSNYNSGDCP